MVTLDSSTVASAFKRSSHRIGTFDANTIIEEANGSFSLTVEEELEETTAATPIDGNVVDGEGTCRIAEHVEESV